MFDDLPSSSSDCDASTEETIDLKVCMQHVQLAALAWVYVCHIGTLVRYSINTVWFTVHTAHNSSNHTREIGLTVQAVCSLEAYSECVRL